MIRYKNTFYLSVLILFSCCKTYQTFYGKTDTLKTLQKKSRRLDISYQNLTTVSDSFNGIEELKMLDLSGNINLNIKETLSSLPNPEDLEVLILDSLNLKLLPENISRFKNLKQLSLSYNPDLDLETVFYQLEKLSLEFLNLKGNGIKNLPENVTNLSTLKDFNLSFNNLKDEDSYNYLAKLPLLFNLWLAHNSLEELPKNIGSLNQIKYLYLDNNKLSNLPKEVAGLKNVLVLHLGFNQFTEFPAVFIKVPNLIMVHINNNNISSFPWEYETEKFSLMSLILDNNPISKSEKKWAEKTFRRFFLLSFKQEY